MSAIVMERTESKTEAILFEDSRNYIELDNLIRNYNSYTSERDKLKALREIREKRSLIASADSALN